ncbi:endo-alpha-N-acetylgalactosaminidase family protein [Paenibacillus sp. UMB7766-LJ446]|uniref:endo-alpha-N-acetylgalactosaminidase family protein n=1 Tax=Paenibacillus sp. UMB7766-LJ446 TaxID=3046313 RepID=UPI00254C7045|nr:endo-alpha-N-acetylgalactosaminidase family protein [Paenibacillus sp. UMB7766-LJ446]MDK8189905.1 endo-alpha-N-acetylgalactosaminidase family protein [Paenibacillus sp. UMB7766-LJ446]
MFLENDILRVEFADLPIPLNYFHKPTGNKIAAGEISIVINNEPIPWEQWNISREAEDKLLYSIQREDGLKIVFSYTLNGCELEYEMEHISEGAVLLKSISWHGAFIKVDDSYSFLRDKYQRKNWDQQIGKGLWELNIQKGTVLGAWPDNGKEDAVHACAYNGSVCCFIKTNWPINPLWTQLAPHAEYPGRSGAIKLGINSWQYRIRDKVATLFRASIGFLSDLNEDGLADECEYQLALKKKLPEPDRLYKDAIWYKVFCGSPREVNTTFLQALEIAERISLISNRAPQVMYLVGWQYQGHDTGYPAIDQLNPKLGTHNDLNYLIKEAMEKYNCIVSLHTNVDDAYMDSPQWDESIIGEDVDGKLMKWEVFNQVQSYHITHTKDVESGSVFRRLDEMLTIAPVQKTIHFDAYRTMNWSWGKDGFIGEAEEYYCGMLPIVEYMKEKGIDITTEALNGMRIEPAGIFSGLWHHKELLPLLYHNVIYGGGRGRNPLAWVAGTSINHDYTSEDVLDTALDMIDHIAMDSMLYRFLLHHDMVEFRSDGDKSAFARYTDGIKAFGSSSPNSLNITWNETLIADLTTRFIPFDSFIYIYAMENQRIQRTLPESWQGKKLTVRALLKDSILPQIEINNHILSMDVQSRKPFILYCN